MPKIETDERAGLGVSACPQKNGAQEKIIFCAHRGQGCISQNGYTCTNGPKCEPMDDRGRRFVVHESIEDGQRLSSRTYLDDGELAVPKPTVAPVIDAEGMNAALLASNNPGEALRRIRSIANETRQDLRNCTAGKTDLMVALNRIVMLTGSVS